MTHLTPSIIPPTPDPQNPAILFTAFEPSGDEHAAPVIAQLRALLPATPIHALGGPKMLAAGAQLIETTTNNPAMLAGAASKILEHRRLLKKLRAHLAHQPLLAHIPTDSPAANWSICKLVKKHATSPIPNTAPKVIHLVAPQVWAWASWRVRRLQKWSDRVLCLLPFEPQWFAQHHVDARFVGHPIFDSPPHIHPATAQQLAQHHGWPRLALLPGSRPSEVRKNWPLMLETAHRLAQHFPRLTAAVAVANPRAAEIIQSTAPIPPFIQLIDNQPDTVLHWATTVLVTSGTATLHAARAAKPMAILFATNPFTWNLIGRHLITTRTFTLPNLIHAQGPHTDPSRHIVPEFVPHTSKDTRPIVNTLTQLIENVALRDQQLAALRQVTQHFANHNTGHEAAQAILQLIQPNP